VRRRLLRWYLLAGGVLVLAVAAAASPTVAHPSEPGWVWSNQHVTDNAERVTPENMDGDDPRARGCAADSTTVVETPLLLPGGGDFGTLRLRHSAKCGTSWGSAYYANPDLYTVRIAAHRPADGAEVHSEWSNNTPPGSYGDMLSTATGCVWVEATVTTPAGTSSPVRTPCS